MTEDYLKFRNFGKRESLREHYIAHPSLETTTITTTKKKREREKETILQEYIY